MGKYILALDAGTTSSRCIIFDRCGFPVAQAAHEFPQIFKNDGWVEHDPADIASSQLDAMRDAVAKCPGGIDSIDSIGITNQRETTLVWERDTGKPIYNAIVWQCRRTSELCGQLRAEGLSDMIRKKTGLLIDPYFSATKLRWILENVPGARERGERGELCFGTVDSWLLWNLTGGRIHATDYSNASRTMLFNINTLSWDDDLLSLFAIPKAMLPEVKPSSGLFGYTDSSLFGREIPICGIAGDQQAALFGQCCHKRGMLKNTYGTGAFLLMNSGEEPVYTDSGLITTIAWGEGGKVDYALEGSVFVCGAAIQWLRDGLGFISSSSESEELARSVPDSGGVFVVPAFVGLGAPYWDPYARGIIYGITRGTTSAHIARATIESMAYQTYDLIDLMERSTGDKILDLRVDGGASANKLLLSFQADITGVPIRRPACVETTALGAAFLSGLGNGFYSSRDEVASSRTEDTLFLPQEDDAWRKSHRAAWRDAVSRSRGHG